MKNELLIKVLEEGLDLLKSIIGIKLKKQKQYDFFLCKEVWVHKLIIGQTVVFVSEEDFIKLQNLKLECITID